MQLNLSSGTSVSSNSNGSSANSPSATTTQNGTRGPATGPRSASVSAVSPTAGPRLVPPASHNAGPRGSSTVGGRRVPSLPAIKELEPMPLNTRGSGLVNGVLADVDRVNLLAKGRLPLFARDYFTTSVSSLVAVLAKQSFLGVDDPNLAQSKPIVVIPEAKLCALFMKALLWFINCECASVDGAVVAFIGKRVHGNGPTRHLALPLAAVRKLADEYGAAGGDHEFDLEVKEFGAHPFHAGSFYVEHSRWALPVTGAFAIIGLCTLIFLHAFLRDVARLLTLLPRAQ